jgi:hypothetical protein
VLVVVDYPYAYGGTALVAGGIRHDGWRYCTNAFASRGLASKQDADNKASYAFGSVTNTTLRDSCHCFMVSVESAGNYFCRYYVEISNE